MLCCLSPTTGAQVEAALTAQVSDITPVALDDIPKALAAHPDARAIILYDSAAMALMTHVRQSGHAGDVLADWTTLARKMLETQTGNRRRIMLIQAHSVLLYADVFAARFGLSTDCAEALCALPRPHVDPVLLSLARACLHEDRTARQMTATLRAATTELSNAPPDEASELESAFQRYAQSRSHLEAMRVELEHRLLREEDMSGALKASVAKANDLARQLADMEQRLGDTERQRSELQAEADTRRGEVARLSKLNDERAQKDKALTAELKGIKARLAEEINLRERVAKDLAKMSQAVQVAEVEADTRRAEVARLRASYTELAAERDAMTGRLEHAETDLERQYHQRHRAEAAHEEIRQKTDALEAEAIANNTEIEVLARQKQELETRLADTEHWLQGILASRSYRIMAPVRRLRAAFKRKV